MDKKPFSIKQTWLRCIGCGHISDLLEERKFRCPECGDLYDIMHDFSFLNITSEDLITTFNARANKVGLGNSTNPKFLSGIWRFKEWIMPFLPDEFIVTLGEGNVPITRAGRNLMNWIGGDIDLHIIQEGMTPTGSFKDFGGTVMMTIAKTIGIDAVACASTGDTSAMAAAYATKAGIKCAVILPKGKVTAAQLAQPLVHGAEIITLPGDFDDCMKVMQSLVKDYGVFPANSLNPSRIEGHQATVFLIAQHFGWKLPNWITAPVGNGSNCSSIGKALRLIKNQVPGIVGSKILGCQSKAANPLARSWNVAYSGNWEPGIDRQGQWLKAFEPVRCGETTATAARIGDPVSRDKVVREIQSSQGAMCTIQENDLNEAVSICGRDGIFVCPQTGTALAGVRDAVKKGWIKKNETVVVVSTATGLKFTESASSKLEHRILEAKDCNTETVAEMMNL